MNGNSFYVMIRHGSHRKRAETSVLLCYTNIFTVETFVKRVIDCISPCAVAEQADIVGSDGAGSTVKLPALPAIARTLLVGPGRTVELSRFSN